ncbi:hypothetical protein IAT38_000281 [Cryptococcus sp. DSM 104549]
MRGKVSLATAFGLAAAGLATATSPPVRISLETGWAAPPLLLEILETVYDEAPESYFPLLHLLSSLRPTSSPEALLSSTLDLISAYKLLPSPSSLSTLHLALSLHSTAPRIEAEYNWYESAVRGNETQLGVEGCEGWVEWRGKGFCEVDELRRDVEMSIEEGTHHEQSRLSPLPFDHVSAPPSSPSSPQAIIYYTPLSNSASSLLNYLQHHSSIYPEFTYVVRYQPPSTTAEERKKLPLAGWGVEMAMKNMDYLVVDDRVTGSAEKKESGGAGEVEKPGDKGLFSHVLGDDPWSDLVTPLTPEELREIGLQASALIMSSNDPLDALTHLSQDFPKYSAALARQVGIPEEIRAKGRSIAVRGQGKEAIYINGKAFTGAELDAYALLKNIRAERHLVLSLTSLGLTPKQAVDLISDKVIGQAQTEDDVGEGLVDASDRDEGGGAITWWNDLEKDKRYKSWPNHIQGYMRPMYPGQFHTVRRNTWNLIFVLDLAYVPSLEMIVHSISPMIERHLPIRFGIVPMFELGSDDISTHMAKIFHYVVKTFGRASSREFFTALIRATPRTATGPGTVTLDTVRQAYESLAATSTKACLAFDDVLSNDDYDSHLAATDSYLTRLMATKAESPSGHLFMNGKHTTAGPHWPTTVTSDLAAQLTYLQEQIMLGAVPDDDISTFFYDLPSTSKRRSKLVIPGEGDLKLRTFNLVDLFAVDKTDSLTSDFVYPEGERGTPITMWVVGNLDSAEGARVVKDALGHLKTPECSSRLGFVHIPSPDSTCAEGSQCLSTAIYQLLQKSALSHSTPDEILDIFNQAGSSPALGETGEVDQSSIGEEAGSNVEGTGDAVAASEFWKTGAAIAKILGLTGGSPHLLVNGRLVGPLTPKDFPLEDFDALEVYEHHKRVKPVIDLLRTMYDDITVFDRATLANLISMTSSVITSAYKPLDGEGFWVPAQTTRTTYYETLDNGDMSFKLGDHDKAILHVAAVIDPLSEQAQRWSTILKTLAEMEHVAVSVYLEPEAHVTEIKLKRFYRSSLPAKVAFDVDGDLIAPEAVLNNLPHKPIYTLGLDTPPSWIVSPKTSPYDLDNLLLSNIHEPVHILFQLKQLLIQGHAREGLQTAPRGLQLQLTNNGLEVAADTQVMANLGYLQFRAVPGLYDLTIREGRGTEVYKLDSVGAEGWDSPAVEVTGTDLSLDSFGGGMIYPRFTRKDGMETADVLQEDQPQKESTTQAVLSKMKSIVGLSTAAVSVPKSRHADINIFTVASGLLYERFASIMILSVMKHTESTVKFWFIENFLSPSFIAFIPKLAEEYGFKYEFVTYKWPHWLRAQTEKQRIIWAYKILFLDVLFPMDLDKVIFVDADQIVRTDMKELVDVDLHRRVYGYAPMGDSRKEMEGFRFWKSGYWKQALQGRPYHISALYVVDLKRFRQLATGDRLRGQYHALSADPNSLANLDQDLPNSMQDTIPIWTLDQDWLWCQTWCSDESLATAKTIDLCQNPLTKEPKLVRARQIPEWDVYDREIAAFAAKVSSNGSVDNVVVASVDDLASDSGTASSVESGVEVQEKDVDEEGSGRLEDEL